MADEVVAVALLHAKNLAAVRDHADIGRVFLDTGITQVLAMESPSGHRFVILHTGPLPMPKITFGEVGE